MSKIACIFPGQGSQSVGMGLDFFNHSTAARKIFELADNYCRTSLSKITFEGPESELKRTLYTQPAILAVSLSAWHAYSQAGGPEPEFVAGHSLGEYTALVSAGAIPPEDAIKLVVQRARLMENCPAGAMSAVIGSTREIVEECCLEVSAELAGVNNEVVVVANYNTENQLVISGSPGAVQTATQLLKESGAKVISLPVGGAFHSPLMSLAADEFVHHIELAHFSNAAYPVVQNFDAQPSQDANEIKGKLSKQIASSVKWLQTIQYMLAQGVDSFVEIGPGKALSTMVKKLAPSAHIYNVSSMDTLKATIVQLSGVAISQ